MSSRLIFLCLVTGALFISCKKSLDPIDFNVAVTDLTATFSQTSSRGNSYSWDFGDNETSTERNPTHRYLRGGLYNVTLTINDGGKEIRAEKQVRIADMKTVVVKEILLTAYDTNKAWDPTDGPDIYIKCDWSNLQPQWVSPVISNVKPSDLPLKWNVTPEIRITDFNYRVTLNAYDDDTPMSPELMGGYQFAFSYMNSLGNLDTIDVSLPDVKPKFRMVVKWQP